jgi:ketosteroid isomerase-like protein
MKKLGGVLLLITVCVSLSWAQTEKKATTKGSSMATADAVKQLEHDWTDAVKAGDADKVDEILADDWRGIGPDGSTETKKAYVADVKSGKLKLETFDFGSTDVKVIGSTAIVQGSDSEKGSFDGKVANGKSVWMDVFASRGGKWVAVRSQTAMVK